MARLQGLGRLELVGIVRGSVCSAPPLGPRAVLMVMLVAVVLLMPGPVSVSSGIRTKVLLAENVRCGCGSNMSKELVVESLKARECAKIRQRRPRELKKKALSQYPLHAKLRRTQEGSEILISWKLSYIPRRKRSRVSEFNLFIVTKTSKRPKVEPITSCFKVKGIRKVCRRNVKCKAVFPESRPRRVAVELQYQYSKGRQRRVQMPQNNAQVRPSSSTYNVLKTSLQRKNKRRGNRRSSAEKKSRRGSRRRQNNRVGAPAEVTSCKTWTPHMTLSASGSEVTVHVTPVNPFADKLELSLFYRHRGKPQIDNVQHVAANITSYTFTDVTKGRYSVLVHPLGSQCFDARFTQSEHSVDVTGERIEHVNDESGRTKRHRNCQDWIPAVNLRAERGKVIMDFHPANHLASRIDVALQKFGSNRLLHGASIAQNVTTYTFEKVEPGTYRASIRALDPQCGNPGFISRKNVTVPGNMDTLTEAPCKMARRQ